MSALLFPNRDALRVALAGGLVPPAVARAPARAGLDSSGHLCIEPDELPAREILAALGRLGVRVSGAAGVVLAPIACWAELLPLRRAVSARPSGPVLFEMPDRALAPFVGRLQRKRNTSLAVRLLPDPHVGTAWVTALDPPAAVLLWVEDADTPVRAYRVQEPGVWVASGWEHPVAELLAAPAGGALLLDPDQGARAFPFAAPSPGLEERPLRAVPLAPGMNTPTARVEVRFRFAPADGPRNEMLWVLGPDEVEGFAVFCCEAPERLLRCFEVATVHSGTAELIVVRRTSETPVNLPVAARGFQRDQRLPGLFVPAGHVLRPPLRPHVLAAALGLRAGHLVWVEPADCGIGIHAVAVGAFRPLAGLLDYVSPPVESLIPDRTLDEPFALARVVVRQEPVDERAVPTWEMPESADEPQTADPQEPGWVARSVARFLQWLHTRASSPTRSRHPLAERAKNPGREEAADPGTHPPSAVDTERDRKLASADALLHGRDRAALRQELETRLLADFSRLGGADRAARWSELAGVYAAGGLWPDAATCWANAVWERSHPPEAWLEQWAMAECRAAGRAGHGADLERWLGEPARPGTGRVVAALATRLSLQPSPPAEFVAALPRVLAVLDQQFDDLPVRAAWVARLAVARVCAGDALGLARWRDRLLRRLHDRGPALDLDEPSFLRFRGTATADRFQGARDWLTRVREPVRAWVTRHGGTGRLQWAGLDGETVATPEYAQLLLAWGLGALGERAKARDWAARARKALGRAGGPGVDPAAHALLGDLFLHRIKEAHEGTSQKPGLPPELQQRLEKLPEFARYSVDRLREHCRVLEPRARVRAARGLELKRFWGADQLGERLTVFSASNPADLNDEARALLAITTADPTTATVSRIAFALFDAAAFLERAVLEPLLGLLPAALDGLDLWLRATGARDEDRGFRTASLQAEMIGSACAVVPTAEAAERLLRDLARGAAAGPLLPAALAAAPRAFRTARTFGLVAEAEALARALDPARGAATGEPVTPLRTGVAIGWFVAGDQEAGGRLLDAAREALYLGSPKDRAARGPLALAYAEALGFAPARVALGRLEELFQRLDRFSVDSSTNRYYTLFPLRLVDAVVRSVVTDEFTLGPAVRAWLDEDEFLIRRRVHRDMAAILRESESLR